MKHLNRLLVSTILALCAALFAAPAAAQIAFVKNINVASSKTSGTSIAITAPAAGVAAGNSIIVSLAMDPAAGTVSCSDTKGNTYASNRDVTNGSGTSGVRTVVLSAHNVIALVSGNTITCTHPSAAARALSANEFSGLATASTVDVAMSATGSSTSPSSGNTATTTQASELLVGGIGVEGPSGDTFTAGTNYTVPANSRVGTTGANAATNITINPEYQIVSATGAYAATGTLGTSRLWGAAIVTYKAAASVATKLVITSINGGSNPTAGVGFPVVVQSQNASGSPTNVISATAVSLSLKTGTGTLGGTLTGTIAAGTSQVTISGVTYTKAESGVVLTATRTTGDNLTASDSAAFTVNPGAASQLAFTTQPGGATTGNPISGPPTVTVQDSLGNTVTSSTASITMAIGTNPSGGTLSGTTIKNAVAGVASFTDLSINQSGNGYTLNASASGLSGATSGAFDITTPAGNIVFVKSFTPNSSKTTGASLALTVPAAGVAAGNSIIISFAMDPAAGTVSCVDTASNSYAVDQDITNRSSGAGVRTVILSAHNVSALVSGNTITCTHPSVAARAFSASEFFGLLSSGTRDQTTSTFGSSTTPSSGNTATTAQPFELLIGAIGVEGPSGDTFTPGSSYTTTVRVGTTGGNAATNITINPEYRIVTATGAYAATATLGTSRPWAAAIVTYKAAPPPVISSLSLSSGPIATPITINGSNFGATQGSSTVKFNGVTATPTSWGATSITALVPDTASTGPVVVTVAGLASNGVNFTVTYSPRVNSGGSAFTDGTGKYWAADRAYGSGPWGYVGGSTASTGDPIANTNDDPIYQATRYGNLNYKFDVPNGKYDVTLHFAEIYWSSANARKFKVLIEGATVLDNYDIFAEVGHDAATSKTFYSVNVLDGQLNIDFVTIIDNALISAISVTPAHPSKLVITSVNSGNTPTAGVAFPVVIQAQNPNGVLTNATVATNVSLSVQSGGGSVGGTISGTIAVGSNQLTLSGVTYSKNNFGVVLRASATSGETLSPGDSAPFDVLIGSPTKLGFTFQPVNSTTSGAIKGPPTVTVQDSSGNTIPNSAATITIAIGTNPGGGALSGTTVKNASSGVASFADLHIDQLGNGYTLTATSPNLTSATTSAFNITAAGNVGGTVTKVVGGGAIAGALVEALQSGVVKGTGSTNSTGSYTITGLAPGTYDIRGTAGGFASQTQTGVTVSSGATATANFSLAVASPTAGIVYIYDELQRLKSVIDPVGEAATYAYDAVGNLLSITRNNATQTSVIDFNPNSGAIGNMVTIYGTGYSATPSQNTVKFNGVTASVASSTLTQIVATVPAGATTGPIAVTSPAGTASSSTSFTVSAATGAPTIASFTPTIGVAGTPLTINGTNFDPTPLETKLRVNTILTSMSSVTSTTINTTIPSNRSSGRISVSTPLGQATSSDYLFIPPAPHAVADVEYTGTLVSGGSSHTISLSAASKIGLLVFEGTAGKRVTLFNSSCTYSNAGTQIFQPNGTFLTTGLCYPNTLTVVTPTMTGTYTVMLHTSGGILGSATFLLNEEIDAGTVTIDGPDKIVTINQPGQVTNVTFTGNAGQKVGVGFISNSFSNLDAEIHKPDGTTSPFAPFASLTLPLTATYTIRLHPGGTGVGTVDFQLSQEIDAGTMTIDGPPASVTINRIGQRAHLTFAGTANQRVRFQLVSNTFSNLDGDILDPSGNVIGSFNSLGLYFVTLPTTGTYTVLLRPTGTGVGSTTFQLIDLVNMGITFDGRPRDRVGTGDTALSPNGALDGVFTVTMPAGLPTRTVTFLQLNNGRGMVWDTTNAWPNYRVLGAASDLDAPLYNAADASVNFSVSGGTSFKIFADETGSIFISNLGITLTVNFSDGKIGIGYVVIP